MIIHHTEKHGLLTIEVFQEYPGSGFQWRASMPYGAVPPFKTIVSGYFYPDDLSHGKVEVIVAYVAQQARVWIGIEGDQHASYPYE